MKRHKTQVDADADFRYERKRDFNLRTHTICMTYEDCLGGFSSELRKIKVRAALPNYFCDLDHVLDTAVVPVEFDFDAFWASTEDERSLSILDLIVTGMLKACRHFGWEQEQFKEAYKCVLSRDFRHSVRVGPRKLRAGRYAQQYWEYVGSEIQVGFVIYDKGGALLGQEVVGRTLPSPLFASELVRDFEWVDSNTIKVLMLDGSGSMSLAFHDLPAREEEPRE